METFGSVVDVSVERRVDAFTSREDELSRHREETCLMRHAPAPDADAVLPTAARQPVCGSACAREKGADD